jgi:hypothetical protein
LLLKSDCQIKAVKTFTAFVLILLCAEAIHADIYSEAIKQAHNVANGQPPQGGPPVQPTPSAAPPQNPPPPQVNPVLEATLQNISNLRADFDALGKLPEIKPDSLPKQRLLNDLTVAAQDAKPSPTSVTNLAENLATAVAGKIDMQPQHAKLAQDIHAIFNSSHLSAAQQEMIFNDVQQILQSNEIPSDEITNVVNGVKTIAAETQ